MPKCYVYLALCDGGVLGTCYYIGTWAGKDPQTRFNMHKTGQGGSRFCQRYKPFAFEVLARCNTIRAAQNLENKITEDYIIRYGFRRVRGGDMLNMRKDCYTLANLSWWLTPRLRPYLRTGLLGCPVPPVF
jgi:predicted GIY-YIG superfamily endonuclease